MPGGELGPELRASPPRFAETHQPAPPFIPEVQAVLRQAVALQQLAALPQEQVALQQVQERVQEPLERVQEKVQGLVEAEAQVEVLEAGQVQDLVQAPLLVEDWVGWVQVEKEKE